MAEYHFDVVVEAASLELAEIVIVERTDYEEEYDDIFGVPFDYKIWWTDIVRDLYDTGKIDPKLLKPGDVVRYGPTGFGTVIDRRKDDDSGWWMTNGTGLDDRIWEIGPWVLYLPNYRPKHSNGIVV